MSDNKIHIPGRKMQKLQSEQQPIVRLTPEAYNTLMEIVNESSLSICQVVSEIIMQGKNMIVFDRKED